MEALSGRSLPSNLALLGSVLPTLFYLKTVQWGPASGPNGASIKGRWSQRWRIASPSSRVSVYTALLNSPPFCGGVLLHVHLDLDGGDSECFYLCNGEISAGKEDCWKGDHKNLYRNFAWTPSGTKLALLLIVVLTSWLLLPFHLDLQTMERQKGQLYVRRGGGFVCLKWLFFFNLKASSNLYSSITTEIEWKSLKYSSSRIGISNLSANLIKPVAELMMKIEPCSCFQDALCKCVYVCAHVWG